MPAAASTYKYPLSLESTSRSPRRQSQLCPQVRVEWDREACANGRRVVCGDGTERAGRLRMRKVAPGMCCKRPLAHAFCSTFPMAAKTVAKHWPPAQPNCKQREKNSSRKSLRPSWTCHCVRLAADQRCCCPAAQHPGTAGLHTGDILTFILLSKVSKAGGAGGNQLCGLMSEMTNEPQFRKQASLGWVLPRQRDYGARTSECAVRTGVACNNVPNLLEQSRDGPRSVLHSSRTLCHVHRARVMIGFVTLRRMLQRRAQSL